jgi:hypothetical protein
MELHRAMGTQGDTQGDTEGDTEGDTAAGVSSYIRFLSNVHLCWRSCRRMHHEASK